MELNKKKHAQFWLIRPSSNNAEQAANKKLRSMML